MIPGRAGRRADLDEAAAAVPAVPSAAPPLPPPPEALPPPPYAPPTTSATAHTNNDLWITADTTLVDSVLTRPQQYNSRRTEAADARRLSSGTSRHVASTLIHDRQP
jgi:hypothetical protein